METTAVLVVFRASTDITTMAEVSAYDATAKTFRTAFVTDSMAVANIVEANHILGTNTIKNQ